MRNRQVRIIKHTRDMIDSKKILRKFRTKKKYFTRDRKLTLPRLAVLVIRGHKMPNQNAINKFFRELDEVDNVPTSSAYSQARRKFKGELFLELNHGVVATFYEKDEDYQKDVKLWKGKRILAADCTIINLPYKKGLRKKYSIQTNGTDQERLQAQASLLYDVLNDIAINVWLDKKKSEKSYLFERHENFIKEDDIITLDIVYSDYSVFAEFTSKSKPFIVRDSLSGTFREVSDFARSQKTDEVVSLRVTEKQKEFVKKNHLPEQLEVRLIKVMLEDSKVEILISNLFGSEYKVEDFKELYGKRWNEETYFNRLKNLFEVEKFTGEDDLVIKQDFYGIIYLSTLESILSKGADEELKEKSQELKYPYQVNRSLSISTMLDYTVDLLMNQSKSSEEVVDELSTFLKYNPCLNRPNRKYDRHNKSINKTLWFYKYKKKTIA